MIWTHLLLLFFLPGKTTGELTAHYDIQEQAIVIIGLEDFSEENISEKLAVYYGTSIQADQPKVIGSFKKVDSSLHFRAKYSFSAGKTYTIIFKNKSGKKIQLRVEIPSRKKVAATFIKNVFPTSSLIPMNQLKFYLEFSNPMRPGNAYEYIQLYRLPEMILETEAFLASTDELWDPSGKRLTIFFDPGRIKRGVQPNLQLGLPLVEGRKYRLVIDSNWLDVNGAKLVEGFEKEFEVIEVDRETPKPENWTINTSITDALAPILIDFQEPMDYGLLNSAIIIEDESGERINGEIKLGPQERQWFFFPEKDWKTGAYRIVINAWLEDLAGNNLRRKFDVDLNDPADQPKDFEEITIPFQINTHSDLKN